jgi:hypothetical protein
MAGTTRSFSNMLNEYLPNELLREEMVKRDYFLTNVDKDDSWLGGNLVVAFEGAPASSVAFGSLTSSSDVAEYQYVRGGVSNQPEVWGTLVFQHRDLMEHNKISEQNFLKILPGQIDGFMDYMKMVVSLSLTNGPKICTLTVDGTNAGVAVVDRIERLVIGQKVRVSDGNSTAVTGYVRTINVNTNTAVLYSARTGGAVVDISAFTTSQSAALYFDGTDVDSANYTTNRLTSIKQSLLSLANGGDTNLYGVAKTAWPYLQAINVDGSSITESNLLNTIFNAYTTIKNKGKGNPNKIVMSYKHLGTVMKLLEAQKGLFHYDPKSTKVNVYGWTEIEIFGVKGQLTIVGIQEMDDDWIGILDMRSFKFYSNGFFRKRTSPDGLEYFESRATTGYSYLVDLCLFGDLITIRPSISGIIYSVANYTVT